MENIDYKKVGKRLKFARELRNITLEKAGTRVNVHKSTILRWENGDTEKFKISTLEELANLYNVNPAWLMGYNVSMEKKIIEDNLMTELLENYKKLNDLGKQKANENIKDLTKINEYTEKNELLENKTT